MLMYDNELRCFICWGEEFHEVFVNFVLVFHQNPRGLDFCYLVDLFH